MAYTLRQAETIVNSESAVNGVFSVDKLRSAVRIVLASDSAATWQSVACAQYIRDTILTAATV